VQLAELAERCGKVAQATGQRRPGTRGDIPGGGERPPGITELSGQPGSGVGDGVRDGVTGAGGAAGSGEDAALGRLAFGDRTATPGQRRWWRCRARRAERAELAASAGSRRSDGATGSR
jgi:hypothetical protein